MRPIGFRWSSQYTLDKTVANKLPRLGIKDLELQERETQKTGIKTVNMFHSYADNIGDKLCGPSQYFWPDDVLKKTFAHKPTEPENVILGGGQVFSQIDKFSQKYGAEHVNGLVAWGVGVPPKGNKDKHVLEVASRFKLFGTRNFDWRDELTFVPCVSCMHPIFDCGVSPEHEVVVFAHKRKTPKLKAVDGIPFMTNHDQDPKVVIDFIAKGATVVTSSYHGVYWAQLMGRKVVCIPYNNKFLTLEHKPATASETDWLSMVPHATRNDPLLEQYRALNRQFADRVNELLNLDE